MDEQHPFTQAVICGRANRSRTSLSNALDAGEDAKSIVENRLVPGIMVVQVRRNYREIIEGALGRAAELSAPEPLKCGGDSEAQVNIARKDSRVVLVRVKRESGENRTISPKIRSRVNRLVRRQAR